MARNFGEIDGYSEGRIFTDRKELHDAGVHAPLVAGISGSQTEGADSIVMSGGYEDDEDNGDFRHVTVPEGVVEPGRIRGSILRIVRKYVTSRDDCRN